ncbi:MAG TPA: hypothetical protein VFZ96_07940 [Actinomycetota bacterium]|nr:hypothetical protein [Actinomycetota bacterium]
MGQSTITPERNRRPPRRELPPELETPMDVGRLVRPVLAVLAVAVLVVVARAVAPSTAAYGGPLQDASLSGPLVTGGKGAADEPASFGIVLPWNSAEREAVLERVVPIGATEGIKVVGAGVLGPEEEVVPFGLGFPPQGRVEPPPVSGFRIPPGSSALDGYQLVVGVQGDAPGVHSIRGFVLVYRAAGTGYRSVLLQGVWLCVPRDEKPRCPDPKEAEAAVVASQEEIREPLLEVVVAPPR